MLEFARIPYLLGEAFHLWASCKITANPWISGVPGASIVTSNRTRWSSLPWALASTSFRRNATSWPSLLPQLLKEATYSTEKNNDKTTIENIENDSKHLPNWWTKIKTWSTLLLMGIARATLSKTSILKRFQAHFRPHQILLQAPLSGHRPPVFMGTWGSATIFYRVFWILQTCTSCNPWSSFSWEITRWKII